MVKKTWIMLVVSAGFYAGAMVGMAVTSPEDKCSGFGVRDGDRVVFLGDSITEQRLYTTYLEAYWLTRYPTYKLTFRNVGWGGDTSWLRRRFQTDENTLFAAPPEEQQALVEKAVAAGLGRDVLPLKPTVVTINFGMNDHSYQPFRQDICNAYIRSQTQLAKTLKASGARVALITPQPLEERRPDPDQDARNQSLRKFSDALKAVSVAEGVAFADQFDPYMALMLKARAGNPNVTIGGGDVIHPGPAGQMIMAWAILKGLGMPSLVSRVALDVTRPQGKMGVVAQNAKVSNVTWAKGVLGFDRLDGALPMPVDERAEPALAHIPFLDELNRYELTVTGLKADYYDVQIDGESICGVTREELAKGWNMAMTPGPVLRQSQELLKAVFRKNDLYFNRWRNCQLNPNNQGPIPELDKQIAECEAKIELARQLKIRHVVLTPTTRVIVPEVPLSVLKGKDAPAGAVWLDTQDLSLVKLGFGTVGKGKAIGGKNALSIGKQIFEHGIGTHAASVTEFELGGAATRFVAAVGVDDMAGPPGVGSVIFQVWVDNVRKDTSGLMRCGDAPKLLSVDLRGAKRMRLVVTDGGDGPACDLADWGGAAVFASGNAVKIVPVSANVASNGVFKDPVVLSRDVPMVAYR